MTRLFKRSWRLNIGNLEIDGSTGDTLDVVFSVEKTDKTEPNTAAITIYNLPANYRRSIEDSSVTSVVLRAGYHDMAQVVFSGDIMRAKNRKKLGSKVSSRRESTDYVTEIEASDAGSSYRNAFVSKSYRQGSSFYSIAIDLVNAMALGEGNMSEFLQFFSVPGIGSAVQEGCSVYGYAHRELDRMIRSCGMTYSIQDGNVQLARNGQPTRETAVVLSPDSGLIGSPTKEQDGTYQLRSLLIPSIYPGRKLIVRASECNGQLVTKKVAYVGDTRGNDWYCDIEAAVY